MPSTNGTKAGKVANPSAANRVHVLVKRSIKRFDGCSCTSIHIVERAEAKTDATLRRMSLLKLQFSRIALQTGRHREWRVKRGPARADPFTPGAVRQQ